MISHCIPTRQSVWGRSDISILIHELGHCLGLDHAAVAPHSFWAGYLNQPAGGGALGAWGAAPQMSYGETPRNGLTADDVIGASLLRPARGWLRTRGAIAGEITVEGAPAPFASVWAIRTSDAAMGAGIGSFADEEGRFLIEGLAPGVYLVRAGPRILTNAHFFPEDERRFDTRDGFALDPVSVSPGLVADGVAVDLRRGRLGPNRSSAGARGAVTHVSAPVAGGEAAWVRHRRAATRNAQDAPCPGVSVRAEPPAPAGNPDPDGRRAQLVTTVTVERTPAAAGVTLDLLDPYASFDLGRPAGVRDPHHGLAHRDPGDRGAARVRHRVAPGDPEPAVRPLGPERRPRHRLPRRPLFGIAAPDLRRRRLPVRPVAALGVWAALPHGPAGRNAHDRVLLHTPLVMRMTETAWNAGPHRG